MVFLEAIALLLMQEVNKHQEEVSFRQTLHDGANVEAQRVEVGRVRVGLDTHETNKHSSQPSS